MPRQPLASLRLDGPRLSLTLSRLALSGALGLSISCARGAGPGDDRKGDAATDQTAGNASLDKDGGLAVPATDAGSSAAAGSTSEDAATAALDAASISPPPPANPPDVDAGPSGGLADPQAVYCAGSGPPVQVGDSEEDTTTQTCTGSIARAAFAHAVCSCTDVALPGFLETRSFSSANNPALSASGAPVGINDAYRAYGYTDVGGTFTIAGPSKVTFGGYGKVGGDLSAQGAVDAAGYIDVTRDAAFADNVTLPGLLTVGRNLVQAPGKTLATIPLVTGQRTSGPVSIAAPCDCAPERVLDTAGIVNNGRTQNDNTAVGLDPNALANVLQTGKTLSLPCGRYYLNSIRVLGSAEVHLSGRTAIFVDGDIDLVGAFTVKMDPGAELDLFVRGKLLGTGYASFGDRAEPKSSRIYVASAHDIVLTGATAFVGNLYAPHATVRSDGDVELFGAVFAGAIDLNGSLRVRYDREILNVDDDCPVPEEPPTCSDVCSSACGHAACIGGTCAPCRSDADCCGAWICMPNGECGPLLQ